jgi:hypothetical protein
MVSLQPRPEPRGVCKDQLILKGHDRVGQRERGCPTTSHAQTLRNNYGNHFVVTETFMQVRQLASSYLHFALGIYLPFASLSFRFRVPGGLLEGLGDAL